MLLLAPAAAFGDTKDFLPTIYSTEGDFELSVMGQRDENTAGGRGTKSSDSFASERLRLYLDGFVYHPRLISFFVKDAGGLYEERYNDNFKGSFSRTAWTNDYEFRTYILPEHPYNLELYTLSTTPYFRQTTAETRVTDAQKGAIFLYRDKPLFFNLGYITGDTEARASSSEYRSKRASGSYITGPVNNTAAYSHTDASTSFGARTSADESSFTNVITTSGVSLDSAVSENRTKQESPSSAGLNTKNVSWQERFEAELPWHFSTTASYNILKYEITTAATPSAPQNETTTETKTSCFTLAHKLYDSVRTYYTLNQIEAETSTGNAKTLTNSLNSVYTKRIPDGRLTISAQGSRSRTEQDNAPSIAGETHTAIQFGTFTLSSANIDPATLRIWVVSDTGALIELTKDEYSVDLIGNTLQISIGLLPQQILDEGHPLLYSYTFQVTYTLLASTVELETTTFGYGVTLALFDNLFTPYYSRLRSTQAVLAGSIPGGPQETDTAIFGVAIRKEPYALTTEQRVVESDISPSRSLRNTAEYVKRISDTQNISAKAEHVKTTYGQGFMGTKGYVEQVSSLNVTTTKNVPRLNLTASLNGFYSQRHSTADMHLYAVTGTLSWKIGALTIDAGTKLNRAELTGRGANQTTISELYYVTVTRKLF